MNGLITMLAIIGALLGAGLAAMEQRPAGAQFDEKLVIKSEAASFRVETVAEGLEIPWAMEFLPGGDALVGEIKAGRLQRLNLSTSILTPISGLPEMLLDSKISSGLFDIRVHPDFAQNGWVYIVYGTGSKEANPAQLIRP